MILGPVWTPERLAAELSPEVLDRLVRDVLVIHGYTKVRLMDGPGDGGRDLEAYLPSGEPVVVQVKHRESATTATSANEAGELALALLRLGRKKGLFVTNGRMSAAAKRDFTSAYPGLELQFWEGTDLLAALAGSVALQALWVNGESLVRANTAVVFGIACRDLWTDEVFYFERPEYGPALREIVVASLGPGLSLGSIERATWDLRYFEPFRAPTVRSMSQGLRTEMSVTEVCIHGQLPLDEVEPLQIRILAAIAEHMRKRFPDEAIALRVSQPRVAALSGSRIGCTLDIAGRPRSLIALDGPPQEEGRYFKGFGSIELEQPSWIQVYQAKHGQFRLLAKEGLLVELEYTCRPSLSSVLLRLEAREWKERWWRRSLFAVVSNPQRAPIPPDFTVPFADAGLSGWAHPVLQREFRRMASGDERDAGWDPLAESNEHLEHMSRVRNWLRDNDAEYVQPDAARHILALQSGDPFPDVDVESFDTGRLVEYADEIPSPIDVYAVQASFVGYLRFCGAAEARAAHGVIAMVAASAGWVGSALTAEKEEKEGSLRFMLGGVDRSRDGNVLRVTLCPARSRERMGLWPRVSNALPVAHRLIAELERLTGGVHVSRTWMRDRWNVCFPPDQPANPMVLFAGDGVPPIPTGE